MNKDRFLDIIETSFAGVGLALGIIIFFVIPFILFLPLLPFGYLVSKWVNRKDRVM